MLQYVYNLVPRGQYTSGKGSSATGLTAYITRDPETKQVVLQTGQLKLFLIFKLIVKSYNCVVPYQWEMGLTLSCVIVGHRIVV